MAVTIHLGMSGRRHEGSVRTYKLICMYGVKSKFNRLPSVSHQVSRSSRRVTSASPQSRPGASAIRLPSSQQLLQTKYYMDDIPLYLQQATSHHILGISQIFIDLQVLASSPSPPLTPTLLISTDQRDQSISSPALQVRQHTNFIPFSQHVNRETAMSDLF